MSETKTEISKPSFFSSNMFTIAHIAIEVLTIAGIAYYFNKRISALEAMNAELVEKINSISGVEVNTEIVESIKVQEGFNRQIEDNLKRLYGAISGVQSQMKHLTLQMNKMSVAPVDRIGGIKPETVTVANFSSPIEEEKTIPIPTSQSDTTPLSPEDLDKELSELDSNLPLENVPPQRKRYVNEI